MFSFSGRNSAREAVDLAYHRIVEQARQPVFFTDYGVPDTVDGRFELICLHAFLYFHRLKDDRPRASRFSQSLFDRIFADFDRSLREMGVGDLSVGTHVKRMARAFYGRVLSYEAGLADDDSVLASALARNVFGTASQREVAAGAMAAYVRTSVRGLCRQPAEELLAGLVSFEGPPSLREYAVFTGRRRTMSSRTPEFSRLVMLSQIGAEPFRRHIEASGEEREQLSRRFDLITLDRLVAEVELRRQRPELVLLEAEFEAEFEQCCAVTLEPVPGAVCERFSLLYGPAPEAEREITVSDDEPAFEPLDGDSIDIGEAVAQELSLSLPAFPRDPEAAVDLAAEPLEGPFTALARLRRDREC